MVFMPPVEFQRLVESMPRGTEAVQAEIWWSNTLLRHFMLDFPLICHPSIYLLILQKEKCEVENKCVFFLLKTLYF